jgi:hypothetical protein
MDTLHKNKEITESCMVVLEQLKARYALEKRKINETIATKSTQNLEDSGESGDFPTDFYQELTKLKLQYDSIVRQEKEETRRLMEEYQSKMSMGSSKDIEKLKVYEKHLTKPVITWDYLNENPFRTFPMGSMKDNSNDAENWRLNFIEVIQIELGKL